MLQSNVEPDHYTFSIVLRAVSESKNLEQGKQLHKQLEVICNFSIYITNYLQLKYGNITNFPEAVANSLINMYAKCEALELAKKVCFYFLIDSKGVFTL